MKIDFDNCSLIITNGLNGKVETLQDFFKHSTYIQEQILGEQLLPILYDSKSAHVSIGYKD